MPGYLFLISVLVYNLTRGIQTEKLKKKNGGTFLVMVNFWTVLVNVAGHYMCGEPCVFCPFVSYY